MDFDSVRLGFMLTDAMRNSRVSRRQFWLKLAAGLLFAVGAYGGAYRACVHRQSVWWNDPAIPDSLAYEIAVEPVYADGRWAGASTAFFWPAHWADRQIRPHLWEPIRW